MLRIISGLLILTSCALGVVKKDGKHPYLYDVSHDYTSEELQELTPKIVTTLDREPPFGKSSEIFGKDQAPLKRVAMLIFESQIQPTRGGLADHNQIYLSAAGKQILTEKLYSIWEESFKILGPEVELVSSSEVKNAPSFHKYGTSVDDKVHSTRTKLDPDDIFFLESGKKTTSTTIMNPREMQDVSFVLVPAYELMQGPKWSEHNKHFLNDVAKELNLDAAIIVMSEVYWTAAHTDKHSGEHHPEEIFSKIKVSTLVPLSRYHERLKKIKSRDLPGVTLSYRAYESVLKVPVTIAVPESDKNFETIEKELLAPMLKSYKDQSQMTIIKVADDLKKTW